MTPTHPIPPEALPVVRRLRLEVERPERLPKPGYSFLCNSLRFGDKCPMGLIPSARVDEPSLAYEVRWPSTHDDAVYHFYCWWDTQTDPQAATDAIWPPDGRWCAQCGSRPVDPAMGIAVTLLTCPECEREFCAECIDAEGDYDGEGWRQIVYPCEGCRVN